MIETINKAWGWTGITANEIIEANDFGNLILETADHKIWRICPEELSCKKIADTPEAFEELKSTEEFQKDWHMKETSELACDALGDLYGDEKYCLKLPGILGGLYEPENFGKIAHEELIRFSGAIALEMKGMSPDQLDKIVPEK